MPRLSPKPSSLAVGVLGLFSLRERRQAPPHPRGSGRKVTIAHLSRPGAHENMVKRQKFVGRFARQFFSFPAETWLVPPTQTSRFE